MSAPRRIQRKRTKSWRMPEGAICVTRPGPYGNPFLVDQYRQNPWLANGELDDDPMPKYQWRRIAARYAVNDFRTYALDRILRKPHWLDPLRGHDLACWCNLTDACHADVLLELANR